MRLFTLNQRLSDYLYLSHFRTICLGRIKKSSTSQTASFLPTRMEKPEQIQLLGQALAASLLAELVQAAQLLKATSNVSTKRVDAL